MLNRILPVILLMSIKLLGTAQENWTLKADKNGIQVFTGPSMNEKIRAVRVVCTLDATLSQLAAVMLDIKTTGEWVYNTKTCTTLKEISPAEVIYHSEVNVPWPVSNRDFIARIKLTQNPATKVMYLNAQNLPSYIPVKEDVVRIQKSDSKWIFTPVSKTATKIEYILFADPGGAVPAWLINMFATKGPMESFTKLKEQVKKPVYQIARYSFVTDF